MSVTIPQRPPRPELKKEPSFAFREERDAKLRGNQTKK